MAKKLCSIKCLVVLLTLVSTNALAETVLSLDAVLTGWTLGGAVTSTNVPINLTISTDTLQPVIQIPYTISPSIGTYMAQLTPGNAGNTSSSVAAIMGLDSAQITGLYDANLVGGKN